MFKRFIGIITLLILLVFSSCSQVDNNDTSQTEDVNAPVKNGVLSLYSTNPDTLNPIITKNKFIKDYSSVIFDNLVDVTDTGVCQPSIATAWEQSKDGLVWIFKIRTDLKWHDGTSLTPSDVVFTIKTIIQYGDQSGYKWNTENISDISIYSQDSVKITLKVPDSFIPEKLAIPVIPEHYYSGNGLTDENKKFKPVGSGPYKFVSYEPSKQVSLAANDSWITRGDVSAAIKPPYIRQINIIIFDNTTSPEKAMNDNITDLTFVDSASVSKYIGRNDVNIVKYYNTQFSYIAFNLGSGVFTEKYMRQFFARAIDIQSIIKDTLSTEAVFSEIPIPPDSYLNSSVVRSLSYDKNKAKDILTQNGWGFNGDTVYSKIKGRPSSITFTILINNDNPVRAAIADKIKTSMQQFGIRVNISSVPWDQYVSMIGSNSGFDMALEGLNVTDIPDPSFLYSSASPFNSGKYKNDTVDKAAQSLQFAWKQDDKVELIKNIIEAAEDDVPYLGLYYGNDYIAVNKRISGEIKPFDADIIYDIPNWYIPKQ